MMTNAMRLAVVLALAGVTATDAAPRPQWPSYTNVRFAYAICYPATMRAAPEAANGDGRVFGAPDGGRLAVFGSFVPLQPALAASLDARATALGERPSYRFVHPPVAVASGRAPGDRNYYVKIVRAGDRELVFELTSPRALAARYDAVATRLGRCFRPTG